MRERGGFARLSGCQDRCPRWQGSGKQVLLLRRCVCGKQRGFNVRVAVGRHTGAQPAITGKPRWFETGVGAPSPHSGFFHYIKLSLTPPSQHQLKTHRTRSCSSHGRGAHLHHAAKQPLQLRLLIALLVGCRGQGGRLARRGASKEEQSDARKVQRGRLLGGG